MGFSFRFLFGLFEYMVFHVALEAGSGALLVANESTVDTDEVTISGLHTHRLEEGETG